MPTNSIDARVEFSFKGENYTYITRIDLDHLFRHYDEMPSIHAILAREHGVDTYSYLYEVMQAEDIAYTSPQGYALDYLTGGEFDPSVMAADWQSVKAGILLAPIASRELDIADLNLHPALKRALVAAYNLGKQS